MWRKVGPLEKKRIGILTYRRESGFGEKTYLRQLVQEGTKMGAEVFLFGPQDVDVIERRIRGFVPTETGWSCKWYGWPDIVIDHYRYYPIPKHQQYLPLRRQKLFRYANNRFSNKFNVYQVLKEDPAIVRWLPETMPYSRHVLLNMLEQYGIVYLKPTNGTGGRSILRVEKRENRFLLQGRTKQQGKLNQTVSAFSELSKRLEYWMRQEKYGKEQFFLQQGLQLSLVPERTVDARVLAQKDGTGSWRLTGMGIRIGPHSSSTSNLHGGGKALPAVSFLTEKFGLDEAMRIIEECRELVLTTVKRLEQHYGAMMEFGFDLGIDVHGNLWIIEINPKPGRDIFRHLGRMEQYEQAVRRPLEYSLFLLGESASNQPGE